MTQEMAYLSFPTGEYAVVPMSMAEEFKRMGYLWLWDTMLAAQPQEAQQPDSKDAERVAKLEAVIKNALSWIEIKHRPPVRDDVEGGKMALIRLHALADLAAAIAASQKEGAA